MMSSLFHNWHWKLLSILFAIILWFMIINYQDPVTSKNIDNLKVDVINADSITSKNMAVEYLEGKNINLKVKGKRSVLRTLSKTDVSVKADLSKVSITGAVDLDVDLPVGVELVNKTPSMMMISIEQIKSTLKSATPFYEGEVANGYMKLQPVLTPNQVEITGTESKLALISSVIVPVNIAEVKRDITLFVKPQILDSSGNEIEGLKTSSGTVEIKVPVQKVETKDSILSTYGEIASDYRVLSMTPSLPNVKVRGYEDNLYAMKSIYISDIDLSTLNDSTTRIKKNLSDYISDGVYLIDETEGDDFYIDFKIVKLVEKEIEIPISSIEIKKAYKDLDYEILGSDTIKLRLKGEKNVLDKLSVETLDPYINVEGIESAQDFRSFIELDLPKGVNIIAKEPEGGIGLEAWVSEFDEVIVYMNATEKAPEEEEEKEEESE